MILGAGTKLGPFKILFAIGAGGMSLVYEAEDLKLHRYVAPNWFEELKRRVPSGSK